MEWPKFCIINGERPVKAVPTDDGGLTVLEYIPERDEWAPALTLLHRLTFGDADTDFVSAEEFQAFVAALRARHHGP